MSPVKLIVAHALIALQVIAAVGYYTWRSDPLDERFAWRMFSVQRLAQCKVTFRLGDPPQRADVGKVFHEAWVNIASRGRKEVIEKMAAHLCENNPSEPVTVVSRCRVLGAERTLSSGSFNLCKTGRL